MRRALVFTAASALVSCFDFSGALETCHASGRCADAGDGGGTTAGGGSSTGGGSMTNGGGTAGGSMAGGGAGGGSSTDGGALAPLTGFCTADGLCWDHPTPMGVDWIQVYVAGANDVWGVGEYGLLAHFDGQGFTAVDVQALTGEPPDLYNGFRFIGGLGGNDIYATGDPMPLLHYDGMAWRPVAIGGQAAQSPHTCRGVSGLSGDAVWVSCDSKLYLGSAAAAFNEVSTDGGALDCALLAADDAGVLCAFPANSSNHSVLHVDLNGAVTDVTPAATALTTQAFVRLANGDLWLGGSTGMSTNDPYLVQRLADAGWSVNRAPAGCQYVVYGVAQDVDGGLIFTCEDGTVFALDGTVKRQGELEEPPPATLSSAGVFAAAAGETGHFAYRDNAGWHDVSAADGRNFYSAQAYGGVLYAAGERGMLMKRDVDAGWSYVSGRSGPDNQFIGGVAVTDSGIFVAQNEQVLRQSGASWLPDLSTQSDILVLFAIDSDIWAATDAGALLHRAAASAWPAEVSDARKIAAMWGSSANQVFAVGAAGLALSRSDAGWTPETVSPTANLVAVSGGDAGLWALSSDGSIYQHDASGWNKLAIDRSNCDGPHRSIAVSGGQVWVAGSADLCSLSADLSMLQPLNFPVSQPSEQLLSEGGALFILGDYSNVLRLPLP